MANSALKITLFMIIISGLLSAFNAIGVYTSASTPQYNLNTQQWYNITSNTTVINTDSAQQSNIDGYSNAATALTDFIIGTVYVKGVIDNFAMGNFVIGVFSTVIQAAIYFLALIGSIAWVLNKFNSL